jgi:hypothetical protein
MIMHFCYPIRQTMSPFVNKRPFIISLFIFITYIRNTNNPKLEHLGGEHYSVDSSDLNLDYKSHYLDVYIHISSLSTRIFVRFIPTHSNNPFYSQWSMIEYYWFSF